MQALAAAGMPCMGERPGFEDPRISGHGPIPSECMVEAEGKAMKLLNPHMRPLPDCEAELIFIRTIRNPKQQALSFIKVMRAVGKRIDLPDRIAARRLMPQLRKDALATKAAIEGYESSVYNLRFEDVINNPIEAFGPIANVLGLSAEAMASVVKPRAAKCLPHLLETTL